MKKALLSLFLIVLLSAIALALPVSAVKAGVPTSGTCGDSLSWSFDSATGTLTIAGTGSMKSNDSLPFWYDLRNDITRVVIGEGCTSVSDHAFFSCHKLTSVSLPKSVTAINQYAFSSCWVLSDISLTNVTFIGESAFSQCYALTELTVPQGVTTIGYGAFSDCNQLKSVTFHNKVTEIDSYAFKDCVSLTTITIPDSVKIIGGSTFSGCKNLTSLHLGSGLTQLGGNAFQDCPKLKSVRIPDKVTAILINTFKKCTALEELYIGAGVSEFVTSAIDDCPNLKAFTLSSNNAHFKLDKGILYTKDGATLVCMPNGFTGAYAVLTGTKTIDSYSCRNAGLESVTIPSSVTTVGSYAFIDCKKLHTINLAYGLQKTGSYAFARTAIKEIVIPESVTSMDVLAFHGSGNLRKITFMGDNPAKDTAVFRGLNATVYYPAGASGWENMPYEQGITWTAFTCDTHTVVNIQAKAPTCTEDGTTTGSYCGVCKLVFTPWVTTEKTGHSYGSWIKNNNLSADWTQKRICSTCGHEEIIKSNNTGSDTPTTTPLENTNQPQPDPSIPDPSESPAESTPVQNATESTTPATENSTVATDPIDTSKDTGGSKNTLIFVGVGIILLGIVAGIIFITPRLTQKKEK